MAQWTRDFYPSKDAGRCDQHGHLWQSRDVLQLIDVQTPLGGITIRIGQSNATKDAHMWELYDCAVCGSIEAVWAH